MSENKNQQLIDGLREAADFLEAHPDFPDFHPQTLRLWVWDNKAKLKDAARQLGSFTKEFSAMHFELHKRFSEALQIEVSIDREAVCKKIVTWECPDDESLLKLVSDEPSTPEQERCAEVGRGE